MLSLRLQPRLLTPLVLGLALAAAPAGAAWRLDWSRTFETGTSTLFPLLAVAWDDATGELLVLVDAEGRDADAPVDAAPPGGQTVWRVTAAGERVEQPLPPLAGAPIVGLVAGGGRLTLVTAPGGERLELIEVARTGELVSRQPLGGDVAALEPVETLRLADGTIAMAGTIDVPTIVLAAPGRPAPFVSEVPVTGYGEVLDLAPARGGRLLALLHGREEEAPMAVLTRGELHLLLLDRDAEVLRRVVLEGRLGGVIDAGDGIAVLLDTGADRAQEWWVARFDDELRELGRVRVAEVEPRLVPRPGHLLAGVGPGFVAAVHGPEDEPWVARLAATGALRSIDRLPPPAPEEPGVSRVLVTAGGGAIYVVQATYVDDGTDVGDAVRILRLVEE